MNHTAHAVMAGAMALLVMAPMANAGKIDPAYDFGTLWPLDFSGVDVRYSLGGAPDRVCITLNETSDEGAAYSVRQLCQIPKAAKTRIVEETMTVNGPPPPTPVGVDDAFLYFVVFSDLIPPDLVETKVNCVVIFQEGGDFAGISTGDDFVIFTNCPDAAGPWFD